ncbi:cyclic nucleotide-binding domain-containing protein [Pedobacter sp. Du54]|uniref:Crp/Fnr family transcriptional regulator n=1 Tax=Pedobacter anseongensis TaxID=3133439 RepID=UPI0030ABA851
MKNLKFNTYLNAMTCSNEPALSLILSQLSKPISYSKNDVIYQRGRIPEHLSYIEKGNAIALSQSKPNRQVLRFWMPNQLICPNGFFNNLPTTQSIVALDNCLISALSYRQLYAFLNDFPQAYKIINALLKAEINLVELTIKSRKQHPSPKNHEALLEALALSFDE